jgi:hypothetical protein
MQEQNTSDGVGFGSARGVLAEDVKALWTWFPIIEKLFSSVEVLCCSEVIWEEKSFITDAQSCLWASVK